LTSPLERIVGRTSEEEHEAHRQIEKADHHDHRSDATASLGLERRRLRALALLNEASDA
jgi:hypothetical protein